MKKPREIKTSASFMRRCKMSIEFKSSKSFARKAIRELLAHKGNAVIKQYISRINASTTTNEISRILADVRKKI